MYTFIVESQNFKGVIIELYLQFYKISLYPISLLMFGIANTTLDYMPLKTIKPIKLVQLQIHGACAHQNT